MTATIRPIAPQDVERVTAIEIECFPKPWESEVFWVLASCQGRMRLRGGKVISMRVAEIEGNIAGYVVWEENDQIASAHLMNIAVDLLFRRRGLASLLITYVFDQMRSHGMRICKLEVRESNLAAIELYKSLGMKQVSRHLAYYGEEDALIFTLRF